MKILIPLFAAALLLTPSATLRAEDADSLKVSEFTFSHGKEWIRQQVTSSMRAGQFAYDFDDDSLGAVELVIFFFGPGQGGGVQPNIDRWIGMFDGTPESKTEEKEKGGKTITYLTAKGTYMESLGGPFSGNKTEKPDHTMLAAILPSDQGDVFLRLTGPNQSVEALGDAFVKFAESPFAE